MINYADIHDCTCVFPVLTIIIPEKQIGTEETFPRLGKK